MKYEKCNARVKGSKCLVISADKVVKQAFFIKCYFVHICSLNPGNLNNQHIKATVPRSVIRTSFLFNLSADVFYMLQSENHRPWENR